MTQHNSLVAVRAGGNDINRRTDQLFHTLDVGTRSRWQLFQGLRAQGRLAPAWHFFVDRLQTQVAVSIRRRINQHIAVLIFVAHADTDGFQAVEYVKLGQTQAGDAVDLDGATQDRSEEHTSELQSQSN